MNPRTFSGSTSLLDDRWELALATALTPDGVDDDPEFFRGTVVHPLILAEGLSTLGRLSVLRYDRPPATVNLAGFDPILTANGDRLRIESFSACNGVLARLDLLSGGFESGRIGHGTTNVDVTPLSQQALSRINTRDLMHLSVGRNRVRVATATEQVEERKVDMPERWVRGLGNASELQEQLSLVIEAPAASTRRFLATLPTPAAAEKSGYVHFNRSELRLSRRPVTGSVALSHLARLHTAKAFLPAIQGMRIYGPTVSDPGSGVVVEFLLPDARLSYSLTPDRYRGFSGEGALLESLAEDNVGEDADLISAVLAFEAKVDVDHLARETALSPKRVRTGLSVLQSNGRIGWDLHEQAFFHRELPVDPDRIDQDNPRLVAARELAEAGQVQTVPGQDRHFHVTNASTVYLVILAEGTNTCSCPWHARHRGNRGPCKHILAARIRSGRMS